MTDLAASDDLPKPIDELHPTTQTLAVDHYLPREDVARRIVQRTDVDDITFMDDGDRGRFAHVGLAKLYKAHADDDVEDRTVEQIRLAHDKNDLCNKLGDIGGFQADGNQTALRKSQMIHMLIVMATGDQPEPFILPGEPDGTGTGPPACERSAARRSTPDAPTIQAGD